MSMSTSVNVKQSGYREWTMMMTMRDDDDDVDQVMMRMTMEMVI